jgi:hypothetical protein
LLFDSCARLLSEDRDSRLRTEDKGLSEAFGAEPRDSGTRALKERNRHVFRS